MNEETKGIRTWVEVDKQALKYNYDIFRNLISPKCKLMAVAKSNAYGHCLFDYAKTMSELGVDWLGVDSVTEAMKLRHSGIKTPILILGHTLAERYQDCSDNNITITISSFEQIRSLATIHNSQFTIHIKIDTGMHRQGFQPHEVERAASEISDLKNVKVDGIFTHFAAAKNPAFPKETNDQINLFVEACAIAKKYFGDNLVRHAAATSGALLFPASHFDMVRIGIGLYGIWTSQEAKAFCESKIDLLPALSWKTRIAEVKSIPAGERISYDFTEKLEINTKIGVLPIGYWNGFRRSLSSVGHVLVNGHRAKVLGRVTMDMIIIDLSSIPTTKVGDEVTLIGENLPVEEMAEICGTSSYEILTQLNPLMKRIYK
ncbi:MAG: alanine racemase [bacterium]